tara:strand:- start:141 stop:410 length:270 start_codon:yes stop_codon:yes gene_type:complete
MALTKIVVNDKKEVILNDAWDFVTVNVRAATIVREDGVDISRSFHRHVVMPDADLANEDADVTELCTLLFTQACKDNYAAFVASQASTE